MLTDGYIGNEAEMKGLLGKQPLPGSVVAKIEAIANRAADS